MNAHRDLIGGARPGRDYPPARPMKCAPRATQIAAWHMEAERERARARRRLVMIAVGIFATLGAWWAL